MHSKPRSQTRSDDRPALEEQRRTVSEEIRRGERALDRYYEAFEKRRPRRRPLADPARQSSKHALESLRDQDAALAAQLSLDPDAGLDPASLAAVADRLRDTLEVGEPAQTKALLRLLIKELRVNGRSEILPTYRVVTPEVCATTSSVERAGIEPATSGLQSRRSPS